MKAGFGRRRDGGWESRIQKLRQDGSMLRFKLGSNVHEFPFSPAYERRSLESDTTALSERPGGWPPRKDDHEESKDRRFSMCYSRIQGLSNTTLGGLRGDPFDSFPIPSAGHVPSAFDFYVHTWYSYGPQLRQFQAPEARAQLSRRYFAVLLDEQMCFEQCIVWSLLIRVVNRNCSDRHRLSGLSKTMMWHTNNVLACLRKRMASDRARDDAVILTMISLAAVCMIVHDFRSLEVHVEAMQRVVSLRGGYENLGWNGYIKAAALSLIGVQRAREQTLQQQVLDVDSSIVDSTVERLHHPYPPGLCLKISYLPLGFRELALSTELSIQHIMVLYSFVGWVRIGEGDPAEVMNAIIALPDFTNVARLLSQTMLAHLSAAYEDLIPESTMEIARSIRQMTLGRLGPLAAIDRCDRDFLIWACLILQRTMAGTDIDTWHWASSVLEPICINDTKLEDLERKFLSLPEMGRE